MSGHESTHDSNGKKVGNYAEKSNLIFLRLCPDVVDVVDGCRGVKKLLFTLAANPLHGIAVQHFLTYLSFATDANAVRSVFKTVECRAEFLKM